ncbi:MAG: adenylate kinase, partial [Candidatus Diapherotrites archaeon CG08_land_8_20_14_0_20_34_12]
RRDTKPLIDYYKSINLLKEVNAEGTIEENAAAIKKILGL